jgi:hypothetical protein
MRVPSSVNKLPERAEDAGEDKDPAEGEGALLASLWPLLGRHIAFHRRLVDLTDNVKAALLLSQAVYWTRHGRDIARRDGWFHKTAEQWELEIGLSAREQTGARELLRAREFLEEQRLGLPARLHYRLNLEVLGRRLAERVDWQMLSAPGTDWHDRMLIAQLLGPAVAFHRALAAVAGGIHGGLLLSRALHLTRLQARRHRDVWIADSAAHWFEELGLSRRAQEAARRDLLALGVWEERIAGMPSSLFARVRLEVLAARLEGGPEGLFARPQRSDAVRGIPTPSVSPNVETRVRSSHNLVSTNPPGLIRQNRHQCFDETAIFHKEQSTGESLQPQNTAPAAACDVASVALVGGGEALIFPDRLLLQERDAAQRLLSLAVGPRQVLLDELAGRLQTERIRSPIAYLRGLIERAARGQFVPELAPRIAAERDRNCRESEARGVHQAEQRRLDVERDTPEFQARERERKQRISALLSDMRCRIRASPSR